jgi:hypothetical protein
LYRQTGCLNAVQAAWWLRARQREARFDGRAVAGGVARGGGRYGRSRISVGKPRHGLHAR